MGIPNTAGQLLIALLFIVPGSVYQAARSRLRGVLTVDGTWLGGWYGANSFVSSFPEPREMFAPRSGGYSASKTETNGRFASVNGTKSKLEKPSPPRGRASAAVSPDKAR